MTDSKLHNKSGPKIKLNDTYCEKAEEYIHVTDDKIPSVAGMCIHMGIVKSTLHIWAKENTRISNALKNVKLYQENKLLNGGLSGEFNAAITKLVLHNHGYSDKSDTVVKDDRSYSSKTDQDLQQIIDS